MSPRIRKALGWILPNALFRPVMTKQDKISWLNVTLFNVVWFSEVYTALLHGVGLAFVARGQTSDPRMIALVSTIGFLFRGTIGPVINYVSDRIWTSMGRRRPFVISAYCLSGVGLVVIPFMQSTTTLIIAVAVHACLLSFASPMEPLYMETVPPRQQGRSQAMRSAFIQASVLYFFQVSLAQFDIKYFNASGWPSLSSGITGVHLAFWLGAALFFLMALYLATCCKEQRPDEAPMDFEASPGLLGMLKTFPRDVFGDSRWWPAYALYIVPSLVGGVWGSLQPVMLVEQFGYDMPSMARIGLPVSLIGMTVIGPVLGYCADRGDRYRRWQLLGIALLLLGAAYPALGFMPQQPRELPKLLISLAYCLPLGLACVSLILAAVITVGKKFNHLCLRSRFIIVSLSGEAIMAFAAWVWSQSQPSAPVVPASTWLTYMTLTQAIGLAATVALMPLLFSKIPGSKFGTVSSGFGVFGAVVSYVMGNAGGAWVHFWTQWRGHPVAQYTGIWLLQTLVAVAAVVIVFRCMRTPLMAHSASGPATVTPNEGGQ